MHPGWACWSRPPCPGAHGWLSERAWVMTSTGSGLNLSAMDAVIDMPSSTTAVVGPPRPGGPTVLGFDQFYDAISASFVPVKVAAPSVTNFVGELASTPLGVMELACVSGSPVKAT